MSIQDIPEKIKQRTGIDHFTLIYLLVIAGVGISAFGLGRLSVNGNASKDTSVIITGTPGTKGVTAVPEDNSLGANAVGAVNSASNAADSNTTTTGKYVASKNGKLYYPSGCKGANRIKEENKVWFASPSEAEGMGYTPSPACK